MSKLLQFLIRAYQVLISPFLGSHCRFTPTCSQYAAEAIKRHGALRGTEPEHRLRLAVTWLRGARLDLQPSHAHLADGDRQVGHAELGPQISDHRREVPRVLLEDARGLVPDAVVVPALEPGQAGELPALALVARHQLVDAPERAADLGQHAPVVEPDLTLVAALALAPISLVQSVIAGGLVLLTVVADRLFAHSVTRREWIGVGLAAAGLAFLAATLDGAAGEAHSGFQTSRLLAFLLAVTLGAALVGYFGQRTHHAGVALGAAAGLLWAASDTAIKASSDSIGEQSVLLILLSPLALLILAYSLIGLTVSAKSLQIGKAVPVIALTSVAANALTIAAGPLVFEEPMPDSALGFSVRILAFGLVISAAALTPAPVRAAEAELEPAPARA